MPEPSSVVLLFGFVGVLRLRRRATKGRRLRVAKRQTEDAQLDICGTVLQSNVRLPASAWSAEGLSRRPCYGTNRGTLSMFDSSVFVDDAETEL